MRRSRALTSILVSSLTLCGIAVQAQQLDAGKDCWVTTGGTRFEIQALPGGYFGTKAGVPSDARPAQVIQVTGNPLAGGIVLPNCPNAIIFRTVWLDPHGTPVQPNDAHAVTQQLQPAGVEPIDTIVHRRHSVQLGGGPVPVEIEMIALSLKSVNPITVTFGAQPPSFFDVFITLDGAQSIGSMGLTPTSANGGNTLVSSLPVNFKVEFRDTQSILPQRQITGLSINFTQTQGNYALFGAGIPTMSEWMLLLMTLVLLSGSVLMFGAQRNAVAANGPQITVGTRRWIAPSLFLPVLGAIVVVAMAAWGLGLFEGASVADYVGGGANALALAYLAHLVIDRRRSRRP